MAGIGLGVLLAKTVTNAMVSTPRELGYVGDAPEEYQIRIITKNPDLYKSYLNQPVQTKRVAFPDVKIKALLQEKISLHTISNWAPTTASYVTRQILNEAVQAFGEVSAIARWTTRRVWFGSSPIAFTLHLKFEAVNDPFLEVLEPCRILQKLVLPYLYGSQALLPPGPNPYRADFGLINKLMPGTERTGEITDVHIGKLLLIKKVIVKDVTVEYLPKFVAGGLPISALVTITFETFEIATKETLDEEIYSPHAGKFEQLPRYEPAVVRRLGGLMDSAKDALKGKLPLERI